MHSSQSGPARVQTAAGEKNKYLYYQYLGHLTDDILITKHPLVDWCLNFTKAASSGTPLITRLANNGMPLPPT